MIVKFKLWLKRKKLVRKITRFYLSGGRNLNYYELDRAMWHICDKIDYEHFNDIPLNYSIIINAYSELIEIDVAITNHKLGSLLKELFENAKTRRWSYLPSWFSRICKEYVRLCKEEHTLFLKKPKPKQMPMPKPRTPQPDMTQVKMSSMKVCD